MEQSSNIARRRSSALKDGGAEYTAKREELVRIAALHFREKGYTATRLVDIAEEAGIDRASLYYYVGNKEELLRESIERVLENNLSSAREIANATSLSVADRLRRIFAVLINSYERNFPHLYVYIQEQMYQVMRTDAPWAKDIIENTRKFESLVVNLIQEGVQSGEFRPDIPVRLVSNALFGMFNWTHRWFVPGGAYNSEYIADAFINLFFDGLLSRSGTA